MSVPYHLLPNVPSIVPDSHWVLSKHSLGAPKRKGGIQMGLALREKSSHAKVGGLQDAISFSPSR